MKRLTPKRLLALLVLAGALPAAEAQTPYSAFLPPTVVILAEHRFDPAVQRWLAEESLKALPLRGGQLFVIVPVETNQSLDVTHIRYLEYLLDKQNQSEPKSANE